MLCSSIDKHIDHDNLVYRLTSRLVLDLEFVQDYTHWAVPLLPAEQDYTHKAVRPLLHSVSARRITTQLRLRHTECNTSYVEKGENRLSGLVWIFWSGLVRINKEGNMLEYSHFLQPTNWRKTKFSASNSRNGHSFCTIGISPCLSDHILLSSSFCLWTQKCWLSPYRQK